MNRLILCGCLVLAWAAAFEGGGKARTGTLRVVVSGPDGAALPGAVVTVREDGSSIVTVMWPELVTDGEGATTVTDLAPGPYAIEATFPGYQRQVITNVEVSAGENTRTMVLPRERIE